MDSKLNNIDLPTCAWCGEESTLCCGSCGDVWYCNKDHKRLHWDEHYGECKSYKINNSLNRGQHLTASRNIKAGSLLLKEEPIVVAPLCISELICLSCYAPIYEDNFFKCPDCFWPMCSMKCAFSSVHELECEVLSKDEKHCGVPLVQGETPRYDLIILLRCLLLKDTNPKMYNVICNMASHGTKLKEKKDPYHIAAVRFFKEVCKIPHSEDEVHQVRGAIVANSIEVRSDNGTQLRGIYPLIRILNHSCVPNVHLSTMEDFVMEARTAINVDKGEELFLCYTGTDSPIWERQKCLAENHYFNCECNRCIDPYELGSMFSSPKCPVCPQLIMKQIVRDGEISWTCTKCHSETYLDEVAQEIEEWIFRLEMNELFGTGTPYKVSNGLVQVEQHFHLTHYIWLKAGQKALRKLKDDDSFAATKLKRYIWEHILAIYEIIEPGITRRRGMILSQLAATIHALADDRFIKEDETSKHQSEGFLREAKNLYDEAFKILRREPKGTPENTLAQSLMHKTSVIVESLTKLNLNGLTPVKKDKKDRKKKHMLKCVMPGK